MLCIIHIFGRGAMSYMMKNCWFRCSFELIDLITLTTSLVGSFYLHTSIYRMGTLDDKYQLIELIQLENVYLINYFVFSVYIIISFCICRFYHNNILLDIYNITKSVKNILSECKKLFVSIFILGQNI
jgi:hypothetical protein